MEMLPGKIVSALQFMYPNGYDDQARRIELGAELREIRDMISACRRRVGEHEIDAAKLVGSTQGIADRINEVQRGKPRNVYA